MDYEQESKEIRQYLEQLFDQAKSILGSWVEVAKRLGCDYTSVARYRRNLKENAYPSFTFYWRLCGIVEHRGHSQDDLGLFIWQNCHVKLN